MTRLFMLSMALPYLLLSLSSGSAFAVTLEDIIQPTPERQTGEGPFDKLVIRGAMVVDGSGAWPVGPMDVFIEGNRIQKITPAKKSEQTHTKNNEIKEIDAQGAYLLPGFIDLRVRGYLHYDPHAQYPDYVYKLLLAHGVTTIRGVPLGPMEWSLQERARSERNDIVAPRIVVYQWPGDGKAWKDRSVITAKDAKEWVAYAARQGVDGVKLWDPLFNNDPAVTATLLSEAQKKQLGSNGNLSPSHVAQIDILAAARMKLGSLTHFRGLFEALYDGHDIQPWQSNVNPRTQIAQQAALIHRPGTEVWNKLIDELIALDFYLTPVLSTYSAHRDLMRAKNADWHQQYTLPSSWRFSQSWFPDDWTTGDEVAWRHFYQVWMQFLNDFKNRGGKVTLGSDAGFFYQTPGFASILEMEMLQEAGFQPLEVIRSATLYGAMELAKAKGEPLQTGAIRPGYLADLVIVEGNPIDNLKVLYGTGIGKYDKKTGAMERRGGIKYTIKDGIIYDARQLLKEVEAMVSQQKDTQQ